MMTVCLRRSRGPAAQSTAKPESVASSALPGHTGTCIDVRDSHAFLGEPMTGQLRDTVTARRSDYGAVRLGSRDIDGLILCAEHYAAPYDLLAAALGA